MNIETIDYFEWKNCLRLTNGQVDLVAAQDFGPRILHFSRPGANNVFACLPGAGRNTPAGFWQIAGGHRLWVAPEHYPDTYHPDNDPVQVETFAGGVRLAGVSEPGTGLQKVIEVEFAADAPIVRVKHRIRNTARETRRLSPWALSVMAPGGTAVLPLRPPDADPEGMLPTHAVALWPYSDPADPRWTWGKGFLLLRQDPGMETPQKVGVTGQEGWAAYVNGGTAFLKAYVYEPSGEYPDRNVSLEVYTDHRLLEVESLGPLQRIAGGAEAVWTEVWGLREGDVEPAQLQKHVHDLKTRLADSAILDRD